MDVSRETLEVLEGYSAELLKWNSKINLIAASTKDQVWDRHILDSMQVSEICGWPGDWIDMGSGGGLPGIVLAIMARGHQANTKFHLVESDTRKCAFLRSVALKFDLNAVVYNDRVEKASPPKAQVISARALASLEALLSYAKPLALEGATYVFPKGQNHQTEIQQARKKWTFDCEVVKSKTNADSAILVIRNLK